MTHILDIEGALKRVRGKHKLLQLMIGDFLHDLPQLLADLRAAIAHTDAIPVERSAHRLKGAALTLGAERLVQVAIQLERLGRRREFAAMPQVMDDLLAKLAELEPALIALKKERA